MKSGPDPTGELGENCVNLDKERQSAFSGRKRRTPCGWKGRKGPATFIVGLVYRENARRFVRGGGILMEKGERKGVEAPWDDGVSLSSRSLMLL